MALLMRRLFVDAQAKLRRMVEEHSLDLASRIDSDYPSTSPGGPFGPFSTGGTGSTASPESDVKLADGNFTPAVLPEPPAQPPQPPIIFSDSSITVGGGKEAAVGAVQDTKLNDCDVDFNVLLRDNSSRVTSNYKPNRHDSIESKKSKSLSVDLNETDSGSKKDVKKTKSDPSAQRLGSDDTKEEGKESNGMTVQDEASPLKDSRSSLETRSDSPKPGCSSQPDLDSSSPRSPRSSDGATRCADDLSALLPSPLGSKGGVSGAAGGAVRRLRAENERLQAEVTRLRRLVVSGASNVLADRNLLWKGRPLLQEIQMHTGWRGNCS
ncbi:unnamed protein product [Acanthoscelides obtectus]|uniref:Uncharacterized protein n=1 Tax=Acanthoscelides obtectus TaxID=200917 RepID=A0A9P0KRF0_ACAOB|nr:unnamed protein product [Acanthoscelides obtectus]CAK1639213.1 hypothetical protein AOBTE_LOCUS11050 [Acanthoscelides obtectus]